MNENIASLVGQHECDYDLTSYAGEKAQTTTADNQTIVLYGYYCSICTGRTFLEIVPEGQ